MRNLTTGTPLAFLLLTALQLAGIASVLSQPPTLPPIPTGFIGVNDSYRIQCWETDWMRYVKSCERRQGSTGECLAYNMTIPARTTGPSVYGPCCGSCIGMTVSLKGVPGVLTNISQGMIGAGLMSRNCSDINQDELAQAMQKARDGLMNAVRGARFYAGSLPPGFSNGNINFGPVQCCDQNSFCNPVQPVEAGLTFKLLDNGSGAIPLVNSLLLVLAVMGSHFLAKLGQGP